MNEYDTAKPYIASFIILRRDNKVAFVLRENTGWMNGFYGLPSGKVEHEETFTECAIREAKEEVGIVVEESDLTYVHTCHRIEDTTWIDVYFEAHSYRGEPYNAEPHMHAELAWLDLDNLPENVIPAVKFELEQIQKGHTYSEYVAAKQ